jgi:RNA polymerase sigma-70 factor (ECF subfamily)
MFAPDMLPCPNPTSFNDLVRDHQTFVYNICLRILKDNQAADDATQETFISAWQHLDAWNGPARPWLVRVAVNKSRDELRRRTRRKLFFLDTGPMGAPLDVMDARTEPERTVMNSRLRGNLETAVNQLPVEQRIVVFLSDVEGLGYRDIAAATRVSLGTVKSRLFRARSRLRRMLQGIYSRAEG